MFVAKLFLKLIFLIGVLQVHSHAQAQEEKSSKKIEGSKKELNKLEITKSLVLKKNGVNGYWLERRRPRRWHFGHVNGPFVFRARGGPTFAWLTVQFNKTKDASISVPFFIIVASENAWDLKANCYVGPLNLSSTFSTNLILQGDLFDAQFVHHYEWSVENEPPVESIFLIDSNGEGQVDFDPQKGTVFLFSKTKQDGRRMELQQLNINSLPPEIIEILEGLLKIQYDLKLSHNAIQAWSNKLTASLGNEGEKGSREKRGQQPKKMK